MERTDLSDLTPEKMSSQEIESPFPRNSIDRLRKDPFRDDCTVLIDSADSTLDIETGFAIRFT
jgi:hypothetical protein